MPSRPANQAGFSLIELMIATTLIVIASGATISVTNSVLPSIRADSQGRRLIAMMQYGRDLAISSRRDAEIRFGVGTKSATLVLMEAGLERIVQRIDFEYGIEYTKFPGMGDTPEQYGDQGVVDFGGATRIVFEPDGTVIDEMGVPVNGTVFLGIPNALQAARAITLTGTTGRARLYRWSREGSIDGGWWSPQ